MLQPTPPTINWLTATEHINAARLQASVWRGGIPAVPCSAVPGGTCTKDFTKIF
jgi:hypothetical protein